MTRSTKTDEVVVDLRAETAEDYVGLWKVFRLLHDACPNEPAVVDDVVSVVRTLLAEPRMQIGQFAGTAFQPWSGDPEERLTRLNNELRALAREPSLGEVAWLVQDPNLV